LSINLTPFIPLEFLTGFIPPLGFRPSGQSFPFKGEGEFFGSETLFLLGAPYSGLISWGVFKRGEAPLFEIFPFPLLRGRGYRRWGY
jgi:hypothetical protein